MTSFAHAFRDESSRIEVIDVDELERIASSLHDVQAHGAISLLSDSKVRPFTPAAPPLFPFRIVIMATR